MTVEDPRFASNAGEPQGGNKVETLLRQAAIVLADREDSGRTVTYECGAIRLEAGSLSLKFSKRTCGEDH